MDILGNNHLERQCICCFCQEYVSREKYEDLQRKLKIKTERINTLLGMLDTVEGLLSDEITKNYNNKNSSVMKIPVASQTSCPWWRLETYWEKAEREEAEREARESRPPQAHFTCQAEFPLLTCSVSTQTIASNQHDNGLSPPRLRKRARYKCKTT